ncbi:MAG: TonB-dependent receptor plug domain-containing protein [Alteripontixanthobacter sp.]
MPFVDYSNRAVDPAFTLRFLALKAARERQPDIPQLPPFLRGAASVGTMAVALACAPAALAQTADDTAEQIPTADAENVVSEGRGQTYLPDYFVQFAPRNALDMLEQVPGFSIQGGGGGERGLGQANENVLVNGERLTSKSDSARDQLSRIPAGDVVRIEIIDGTSLDIPGLTGQVANVVVESSGLSGQFTYEGGFRPHNADPELYGGEISVSGGLGRLGYTLALSNENGRFGADGPIIITDAAGALIEQADAQSIGGFDNPTASAKLRYDFGGETIGNLNLTYERGRFFRTQTEDRLIVGGPDIFRTNSFRRDGPDYEINGDIAFPLGAGSLKLIALEAYDESNFDNQLIDAFADDTPDLGSRFTQAGGSGERIGRFEYNFPLANADWQLSGEAAFNRLDRVSELFELDPDGEFAQLDFDAGTGGVREDRYEAILSFSRTLSPKLSLQASGGYEFSEITQTGAGANARSFKRPKGSASLAWKPQAGLDLSLEVRRSVGQLDFGDFLARVFLDEENANSGNNQLVPEQSWDITFEANKSLGDLGSATLRIERRLIEDFIDVIPLPGGGESRGNIDSARSMEIEFESTLKLDTLGVPGGQIDLAAEYEPTSVRDPVGGFDRAFSGKRDIELNFDFRHDIPRSSWAYGAGMFYQHFEPQYRLSEISIRGEGPTFADVFVENKDVLGLTVRATYANVLGGRDTEFRTVFDGPRDGGQIAFIEDSDRRIGPIFRFSVSGNF